MELKRKMRLAIELIVVASALPLLLLGCGGGGGGSNADPNAGRVYGQFWTDLTSNGVKLFYPGALATASSVSHPASSLAETAVFISGGGRYAGTRVMNVISGVAWVPLAETSYYLASGGWKINPSTASFTASNSTTYSYADVGFGVTTMSVSSVNLSGTLVAANSAVPAVDSLGYASSVLPASATYPASSYEYVITSTTTNTTAAYWVYAEPNYEVTTTASSTFPITAATFTAADFQQHTTTADPICARGFALVYSGTPGVYNFYGLALNGGVPAGTLQSCRNATVVGPIIGTYQVTFATIWGTTVVTFSTPTGWFLTSVDVFGNLILGVPTGLTKAYYGNIVPVGASTNTSYYLNKAAMDTALGAWGVPTF